jgi:hypothetical protein
MYLYMHPFLFIYKYIHMSIYVHTFIYSYVYLRIGHFSRDSQLFMLRSHNSMATPPMAYSLSYDHNNWYAQVLIYFYSCVLYVCI